MIDEDIIARFWARVDRSGGPDACWPWQGPCGKGGYGNAVIRRLGTPDLHGAHRIAYFIANDSLPPKRHVVMHKCDNPPCCNPAHLEGGTCRQNLADAVERLGARPGNRLPRHLRRVRGR